MIIRPDSTEHIIKSIIDERIVYFTKSKYKEISASARNVGIAVCNGRYIAFCDSDDVWFETKTRRTTENIECWKL